MLQIDDAFWEDKNTTKSGHDGLNQETNENNEVKL